MKRFLAAFAVAAACTGGAMKIGPGMPHVAMSPALGVTGGGAKDIGFARKEIAAGRIPPSASLMTEGLLSEHDLPVDGAPCTSPICIRPALVEAPSLATGKPELWLHLGMSSSVDASTLKRPPMDLVVAIDKSGSMSVDMKETNAAVNALIGALHPDDRVAILAFDDHIDDIHPLGPIRDPEALRSRVRAIQAGGSWNIQPAIDRAYQIADTADKGRLKRVAVLSCGYPSVSADRNDAFSRAVRTGADRGIGMTFVGVLLGFHPNLAKLLGDTHGGTFHFADRLDTIEHVFDKDLDLVMTPIAYDLGMQLQLAPGYQVGEVFGLPGTGSTKSVELQIATVFFSRNRGAIVVRLDRQDGTKLGASIGKVKLGYKMREGERFDETVELATGSAPGARKAVALVNTADRLRAAIDAHHEGDREGAMRIADQVIAMLDAEATALADDGLRKELALARSLRRLFGPDAAIAKP